MADLPLASGIPALLSTEGPKGHSTAGLGVVSKERRVGHTCPEREAETAWMRELLCGFCFPWWTTLPARGF